MTFFPLWLNVSQAAAFSMTEMESGTLFRPVLSDPLINEQAVSVVMLSGKIYYELIKLKNAKLAIWTTQARIYITDRRTYSLPFWSFLNIDLGFKILKSLGTRARGTMYVAGLRRCFRRESHWTTLLSCIILEREQSALPASRIGTLRLYQKQQRMEKKRRIKE